MSGTRFRVFPRLGEGWAEPETVTLPSRPGTIGPGPADARMRAVLPERKAVPYDPPSYKPPFAGRSLAPAHPDRDGHFDTIAVDDPAFKTAHMYASVRLTLEAWEQYLGHRITWWHAAEYPLLELIAYVDWDNAQSGMGFIEAGRHLHLREVAQYFCLNFDVLAHETGHVILFSELGAPAPHRITAEFLAAHESLSDLIAMVASMQFPSVTDKLLAQTGGNLYGLNLLSRIGELSDSEQIRLADNSTTMSDLRGLRLQADGSWFDPSGQGRNAHALAQPLTGAMFDLFVEFFQTFLVDRGVLPPRLDARPWSRAEVAASFPALQASSAALLGAFAPSFRDALRHARDMLGACIAEVIGTVRAEELSFARVAGAVIAAAAARGYADQLGSMVEIFALREIDPAAARPAGRGRARAWSAVPYAERARRVRLSQRESHTCNDHSRHIVMAGRLFRDIHQFHTQRQRRDDDPGEARP